MEKANASRKKLATLRILCSTAAAACAVLIVRDLPSNAIESATAPQPIEVARIARYHGQIRISRSEFERQETPSTRQTLIDGTLLETLESSVAHIQRRGGSAVTWLGPKSKSRFTEEAVELIAGSLSVQGQETIRAGQNTLHLTRESEVRILGPRRGRFKLRVQAGSVTLLSRAGTMTVRQNEEATFREEGNEVPRAGKSPFTLLSPRSGEILSADQAKITFRWNVDTASSEGRALELVIAESPSATTAQQTAVVAASEPPLSFVEIKSTLPPARHPWYWRVRARGDAEFNDSVPFWILPDSVPLLRFPLANSTSATGTTVHLSWDEIENADGYQVEIGGNTSRTPYPWLVIPSPTIGITHWRVRALLTMGGTTPWSTYRELRVNSGP